MGDPPPVEVTINGSPDTTGSGTVTSVNGDEGPDVVLDAPDVGADPAGTAAGLLTAHTGAADPHPQYLTPAEGAAAYDALGAAASAQTAATAAAAMDATTKANAAQAAAVATAAGDATTKANGAQAAAIAASDPSGAASAAQAYARDRSHHTGSQLSTTISDFDAAVTALAGRVLVVDNVDGTVTVTVTGGGFVLVDNGNGTADLSLAGQTVTLGPGPTGRGITTVARTSGTGAAGSTDTYTITYSDATTSTFTVVNGTNGTSGATVEPTTAPPSTNTTGSVLGTSANAAHADHTHAIGAHDHTTTAKGGTLGLSALSATGTPSSTTYLRGDNTWATPGTGTVSPGIVVPMLPNNPRIEGIAGVAGNKSARGVRVRCPVAGTLSSFAWYVGASSGNVIGWITDVGQASSGNYSKLWDSGSVAVGTVNLWQNLGSPSLAVTAGQELVFWIMFDNSIAAYGRSTNPTTALYDTGTFPVPAGITEAILGFNIVLGTFAAPTTIAHSSGLAHTTNPQIIARIA